MADWPSGSIFQMIKRAGLQGPSKKRAFGALAFSTSAVISAAAIAGGASAAVLLFTSVGSSDMNAKSMLDILKPAISALTVTTLTTSAPGTISSGLVTVGNGDRSVTTDSGDSSGDTGTDSQSMKLGVNLTNPSYWAGSRAFMNLAAGSYWQLVSGGKTMAMPADRLDIDQNVVNLASGEQAVRVLTSPVLVNQGQSVDIVCRWTGSGDVTLVGTMAKNPRTSGKSMTFTWVPGTPGSLISMRIRNIQADDPTKNIDCREVDAAPGQLFDPTFISSLQQYNTARFLKWMKATEENLPVSWETRTTSRSGTVFGPDGVSVEYMVALANEAYVNPWFTIPWNADDNYIRKFAEYVRDNLNPGLTAYVETSNEVWNWSYKVTSQARDEGVAQGLGPDDARSMLRRYAQRSGEVLDIWTNVYQGQMSRLVRVLATQNANPWSSEQVISWDNVASKADALATAPYFDANLQTQPLGEGGLTAFFQDRLPQAMDDRIASARQQRDLAKRYGLRYIAYEAGQHVTASSDVDLLLQIQRDPRMGQLYTRYLNYWRNEFGDLMVLFVDYSPTNQYGGWGLQEYIGQPLSEAPKAQAVDLFRRSYLTGDTGKTPSSLASALRVGLRR